MHELGVVFNVIKTVEDIAAENRVAHVNQVTLEIGEVTGIIPDYLTDCWNWAVSKHAVMTECALIIEQIPAVTHCDGCGCDYPTVQYAKICPNCGSEVTWLLQGNEFIIKEITVEPGASGDCEAQDGPEIKAGSETAENPEAAEGPNAPEDNA